MTSYNSDPDGGEQLSIHSTQQQFSWLFPNHNPNKFQVKVPYPLTLTGDWEVCLVDIQYHTSWLSLEQPKYFILWMLPDETSLFNLINDEAADSKQYYLAGGQSKLTSQEVQWSTQTYQPFNSIDRLSTIIALPAGHYDSISDCVSALNQEILMFWSKRKWPAKLAKQQELDLSFHYNSITNQVNASHIGFKAIQIVSTEPSIISNLTSNISKPISTRQ